MKLEIWTEFFSVVPSDNHEPANSNRPVVVLVFYRRIMNFNPKKKKERIMNF